MKPRRASAAAALDRFLQRAAQAPAGDPAVTEEMARVKTWRQGHEALLKFTFHAGREMQHFLAITVSAPDGTAAESQFFNPSAVRGLRHLLLAFAADAVPEADLAGARK